MSTQTSLKEKLQAVDPYEFEDLVGGLWEKEGWNTTVSQGSNDMGVDVIAEKDGTIGQKLAIQAKRYSDGNKVGRPKVQQYHSLKEQDTDADAAVVVTTSSFTKDAQLWANDHNVKLVDGDGLVNMVRKHNAEPLVNAYAPDDLGEPTSTETTDTTSTDPTSNASTTGGKFGLVGVAGVAQVVGLTNVLDPSLAPALSVTIAMYIFGFSYFATPFLVFLDANELHKNKGSAPNRIVWPAISIFPVIGIWYYIINRS